MVGPRKASGGVRPRAWLLKAPLLLSAAAGPRSRRLVPRGPAGRADGRPLSLGRAHPNFLASRNSEGSPCGLGEARRTFEDRQVERTTTHMSVCLYVCMSICMSVCLYAYMSVCLYVCMSACLCTQHTQRRRSSCASFRNRSIAQTSAPGPEPTPKHVQGPAAQTVKPYI